MTASVQGTHNDVESGRSNSPAPLNVRSKGNRIKSSVSKQVDELRFHGLIEMLNRVRRRSMQEAKSINVLRKSLGTILQDSDEGLEDTEYEE
jgi:hypothetical protein